MVRLGIKREEGGRLFVSSKIRKASQGRKVEYSKRERIKRVCLVCTVRCRQ